MDEKDSGGRAFPMSPGNVKRADGELYFYKGSAGMSLRDYFAAKAMQAVMSTVKHEDCNGELFIMSIEWYEQHAGHAYSVADAMLKARNS